MERKEDKKALLTQLRKKVNKIDDELIELLAERRKLSLKIIKTKNQGKFPLREIERENEILNRAMILAGKKNLDADMVLRVFKEIIDDSINLQKKYRNSGKIVNAEKLNVAMQGVEGSYSYLAAKKYFSKKGAEIKICSRNRFEEAAGLVESGEADYAILPIENTTSGGINEVYDLLLHTTLTIVGEEIQKITHCLASVKEVPVQKLKKIFAHYQAAAQCSLFLSTIPDCPIEYYSDTAMSFVKIKELGNPYFAAIAGEDAAELYGLKILKKNVANQKENYTRFLIVSRKPEPIIESGIVKTSLVMSISNRPGALVKVLGIFKKYNINLTKLESRPIQGNPFEEMFYLDFAGNISDKEVRSVLEEAGAHTGFLKMIGCYNACRFEKQTG